MKPNQRKLMNYKLFAEGVIFLMKRKTKTGVKLLTQVIDRMKPQQVLPQKESDENQNTENLKPKESQTSLSSNSKMMIQKDLEDAGPKDN